MNFELLCVEAVPTLYVSKVAKDYKSFLFFFKLNFENPDLINIMKVFCILQCFY